MYGSKRFSTRFLQGIQEFIKVALKHQSEHESSLILCPCCDCNNSRGYRDIDDIVDHIVRRGFKGNYTTWTWHGESIDHGASSSMPSSSQHNHCDNGDDNEIEDDIGVESEEEEEKDRIDDMMHDVEDHHFVERPHMYDSIIKASATPLYPGSTQTVLGAVIEYFNLKVENGWTNKSFSQFLEATSGNLPEGNKLPRSNYEAQKLMCPLGMDYEKIHACPNDCVLYRKQYANLHECPRCGLSRYKIVENDATSTKKKPSPAKVLWYLPIIPRFKRLFSEEKTAKLLRWHAEGRKKDGLMRHPADSPQWRNIDRKYKVFREEVRNLRLGLCTDGMNPFGTLSTQYSTWPVLLTIYNLPPWLCMKRRYIMLSLLISGPKQPGNDIDVYLEPLIEDLKLLWDEGVLMFDAYTKTNFTLRAMIFCTINDFPAYGNLSGYSVKGKKACPVCHDDLVSRRLKFCGKDVYMDYRMYLPEDHPFRKEKEAFNGELEMREAPAPLCACEVYERVKDIETGFGKPYKGQPSGGYKKRSIFWDLPYWRDLEVRHCLDVMHIEKNVCDAIVGTLLNMQGKTKDGPKVRQDMAAMGRSELAPQERGKRWYLPPACFTLSKKEKVSFCESLHGLKVPAGYSSNFRRLVSMSDLKLVGMKSHDCHVLMQQLLPVAIRGILPPQVRYTSTRLCFFFNTICSKVINPTILDDLQADVLETMCRFEKYFPPSFFDMMPHLIIHLVREIKLCGPVCMRYMYPFEREMGTLKDRVMNPAKPEASIVQRTVAEEVAAWVSQYMARLKEVGVPKSRHDGRLGGQGTIGKKRISISSEMMCKVELFVVQSLSEVHPYVAEHMNFLREQYPSKNGPQLIKEHNRSFLTWFKRRVMDQFSDTPNEVSDMVRWLAYGPKCQVISYEGYDINGYSFYTKRQDDKTTMQNSGVTAICLSSEYASVKDRTLVDKTNSYYGVIEEILELEYKYFKIPLFRCKWVDISRGVKKDEHGYLTLVNFSRVGHLADPFILASQAKQIFYMVDPADRSWSVVLEGKRRILGVEDVDDEEEYDEQFNEIPPSSWHIPQMIDDVDMSYTRRDHDEGFYVEKEK
jgi:ssDNA-binding Zn-finger/Zn-ribbon topoisomerase 1